MQDVCHAEDIVNKGCIVLVVGLFKVPPWPFLSTGNQFSMVSFIVPLSDMACVCLHQVFLQSAQIGSVI